MPNLFSSISDEAISTFGMFLSSSDLFVSVDRMMAGQSGKR